MSDQVSAGDGSVYDPSVWVSAEGGSVWVNTVTGSVHDSIGGALVDTEGMQTIRIDEGAVLPLQTGAVAPGSDDRSGALSRTDRVLEGEVEFDPATGLFSDDSGVVGWSAELDDDIGYVEGVGYYRADTETWFDQRGEPVDLGGQFVSMADLDPEVQARLAADLVDPVTGELPDGARLDELYLDPLTGSLHTYDPTGWVETEQGWVNLDSGVVQEHPTDDTPIGRLDRDELDALRNQPITDTTATEGAAAEPDTAMADTGEPDDTSRESASDVAEPDAAAELSDTETISNAPSTESEPDLDTAVGSEPEQEPEAPADAGEEPVADADQPDTTADSDLAEAGVDAGSETQAEPDLAGEVASEPQSQAEPSQTATAAPPPSADLYEPEPEAEPEPVATATAAAAPSADLFEPEPEPEPEPVATATAASAPTADLYEPEPTETVRTRPGDLGTRAVPHRDDEGSPFRDWKTSTRPKFRPETDDADPTADETAVGGKGDLSREPMAGTPDEAEPTIGTSIGLDDLTVAEEVSPESEPLFAAFGADEPVRVGLDDLTVAEEVSPESEPLFAAFGADEPVRVGLDDLTVAEEEALEPLVAIRPDFEFTIEPRFSSAPEIQEEQPESMMPERPMDPITIEEMQPEPLDEIEPLVEPLSLQLDAPTFESLETVSTMPEFDRFGRLDGIDEADDIDLPDDIDLLDG